MSDGLETTLDLLGRTKNEAAVGVLIAALGSTHRAVQEGALKALARRRSPLGHRTLLARWHTLSERWKSLISEHPGRMSGAVRDAVLAGDARLCINGCDALLRFREYDLMPVLIHAAEDEHKATADRAAKCLSSLAQLLYEELSGPRDYRNRRDPQLVRQHLVATLELAVERFEKHRRMEIIEAFLLLVQRDNVHLKKILKDPFAKSFRPVVDVMSNSCRGGVIRLVLSFLDDPHAPSSAMNVIANRCDKRFLVCLMKKIGFEPSAAAKTNLKRMTAIRWARDDQSVLGELDGASQHAAMQMALHSGMNRLEVFNVVRHLLLHGKDAGRRAASAALSEFKGAEANDLTIRALADEDPQVQANALVQLRQKGIPGALTRLIDMVDSPRAVVRDTARECLDEFNFARFLASFDMLDEEVRRSTGRLVKKVDPTTFRALAEEMRSLARGRRLRAMEVAVAIEAVEELQEPIIRLLSDEDHMVRTEAARTLSRCNTEAARQALGGALLDRSVTVRDTAQRSLQELARRFAPQLGGPLDDAATVRGASFLGNVWPLDSENAP